MPELSFHIGDVAVMPYAAIPTLAAKLHIRNADPEQSVHSVNLNCQVQIEPLGRAYTALEEARLLDLFGERERWARTMKPMLWTNTAVKAPAFSGEIIVDLPLPCTLDFDVAATKYFFGLETGRISVSSLFSGTVFYAGENGSMQIAPIPWDREAKFHISIEIWKAAIDAHYPNAIWLRLQKGSFDRLYRYKVARGIPMWEQLLDRLMDCAEHAELAERAVLEKGMPAVEGARQ